MLEDHRELQPISQSFRTILQRRGIDQRPMSTMSSESISKIARPLSSEQVRYLTQKSSNNSVVDNSRIHPLKSGRRQSSPSHHPIRFCKSSFTEKLTTQSKASIGINNHLKISKNFIIYDQNNL